jgi:hypothetical protein
VSKYLRQPHHSDILGLDDAQLTGRRHLASAETSEVGFR